MNSAAALLGLLGLVLSVGTAAVPRLVEANPAYNSILSTYPTPTTTPTTTPTLTTTPTTTPDLTTTTTTTTTPTTTTTTTSTTFRIPAGTAVYTSAAAQSPPSASSIMCPQGWEVFEGRCYYFVTDILTWPQALSNCEMLGSTLTSVHSAQQYGFLQQLTLSNQRQNAWLGGFYLQNGWMWLDGSWFYNNTWGQNIGPEVSIPCLLLNTNEGWSNNQCDVLGFSSICAKSSNVPSEVVCPQGWMGFQGRCYKYNQQGMTWAQADTYCAGLDASLVSVHTLDEYRFLTQNSQGNVWLGGFFLENEWLWLDGSWFYQGFYESMSTPDTTFACLSTYTANGWTNYPCDDTFTSFCVKSEVL